MSNTSIDLLSTVCLIKAVPRLSSMFHEVEAKKSICVVWKYPRCRGHRENAVKLSGQVRHVGHHTASVLLKKCLYRCCVTLKGTVSQDLICPDLYFLKIGLDGDMRHWTYTVQHFLNSLFDSLLCLWIFKRTAAGDFLAKVFFHGFNSPFSFLVSNSQSYLNFKFDFSLHDAAGSVSPSLTPTGEIGSIYPISRLLWQKAFETPYAKMESDTNLIL